MPTCAAGTSHAAYQEVMRELLRQAETQCYKQERRLVWLRAVKRTFEASTCGQSGAVTIAAAQAVLQKQKHAQVTQIRICISDTLAQWYQLTSEDLDILP